MFVKSWIICLTGDTHYTYSDVPKFLKKQVSNKLIEMGREDLIVE